ncbi:hypothetical protein C7999DRAFT_13384 [Corynascus novoguineensis]|uniref:Transcription factor n=1 Tax=Corynascus novoguineensis TaxID=1126955 RepID=A0AAN7HQK5_9PEZI|nr:hypothetical protein C7999DRAFT_13384 [Corynascus novoguineensis]
MARHGSVGAFSGFSVCQPALGATLQWLPAIGTAELDDMINALLPGPASIQDKRAHISMDFFEHSRRTGETFKFYPVPAGSFTSATASPATSALYDSGYASSFNHSPVLSEQGSWIQSPAPFAPAVTDVKAKPRSSSSKKSSASSSRQQTVDFANHPGMRILTKDGRDVTNSASRGCKTKEQRDHAHLMRIIKACDSCKKKKVRCDPSHRKRNASQTSTAQPEQKPAKRVKKAEETTRVATFDAPINLTAAEPFAGEELSFPSLDASYPQESEDFWNEFITLDQEPIAAAPVPALDEFIFDSFTDIPSFFSPSSDSSATSPSQILTPVTPERAGASPVVASDFAIDVAGEFSQQDPTVPYLNPGVAHGTNYLDFNLYSPGPEVFDEDPVLQLRDLGSQQQSPQSTASVTGDFTENAPRVSTTTDVDVRLSSVTLTSESSSRQRHAAIASPVDLAWYYDPEDTPHHEPHASTRRLSINRQTTTNHNRLLEEEVVDHGYHRRADVVDSGVIATTRAQSPVPRTSSHAVLCSSTSTVVANTPQSSVSPNRDPRLRRISAAAPSDSLSSSARSHAPTEANQFGKLDRDAYVRSSSPTAASRAGSLPCATETASSSVAGVQSHKSAVVAVRAGMSRGGQSCASRSMSQQRLAGRHSGSSALDGQHVTQQDNVAVNANLATMLPSTLPTRCNVAGEDANYDASFFQLAVFGLVSFLCACALQAHLASQVSLVNILAITTLSVARLAPRCSGPSSATSVASNTLPPPTLAGTMDSFLSMVQPVVTRSPKDRRSAVSRWARRILPRPPSVRTLRV